MTHLLKLDTFFHALDARIMMHDASRIRTTYRVDPALQVDLRCMVRICGALCVNVLKKIHRI